MFLTLSTVFAFTGSGSGTSGDPYIITTPAQFVEIELDMDAYYELGNDIDFTGVTDFFGIGDWNSWDVGDGFNGSFDGKGYAITNLVQDDTYNINNDAGGIFGVVYGGTIRNVSIVNTTIIAQNGIDQHSCFIGTMSSSFYGAFTPNFLAEYITIEGCRIYGDTGGSFATLIGGYSDDVSDVRFENIDTHATVNLNTQPGTVIAGLYANIDGFNGQTMYSENITGNFTFDFNMTTANNPPFYTNVEFGGIASYMFSNSEYKNVKLDIDVYANDTFGSSNDGFSGLTYMYSAGITSGNLYFGTDVTTIYEDVVIDFHERMTTQNPYVLSENTGGTTCTDVYFIINPGVTPVDTGCAFGSVTGVTRANAGLESSFTGLDFVNTWTMVDEPYLTQFVTTSEPEPHIPYTFNDIKYFWDFEGDTPLLDVINSEPLTDYGADYLIADTRCVGNSSCYEIGFSEGYLKHETGTRLVGYEKLTMCVQNNYESDNLFSPILDSSNGGGGRYWGIIWSSPDAMRWGVNTGVGDIAMGNINEVGNYHWCTTMDNETNTICGYRDGVLLGCDPASISDVWSNWGTGSTTTNIGKITGSNNYAEATFDNLLIIGAILNDTEIQLLYENDGVPTVLFTPFVVYVRDNQTNVLIQDVTVTIDGEQYSDADGIIQTNIIDGRLVNITGYAQYYFANNDTNVPTTNEYTLYLTKYPQDQPSQNETDWFDGWDFNKAFAGLSSCPLDNGETDRDFFKWMIAGALVLFIVAYVVDHSIIGLLSGGMMVYLGFLMVGCSTIIGGFMILLAFVMMYYSFTKLSINGSDEYHQ